VKEQPAEAIRITLLVTGVLDRLGVPHAVVGSMASSLHGIPRSTNDVDIIAALRLEHVVPLADALRGTFYVDADMIRDATIRRSEFNVIHLGTMFKVDIFVPALDEISLAQLGRAGVVSVHAEGNLTMRVASAEDTALVPPRWRDFRTTVAGRRGCHCRSGGSTGCRVPPADRQCPRRRGPARPRSGRGHLGAGNPLSERQFSLTHRSMPEPRRDAAVPQEPRARSCASADPPTFFGRW
jgi:hypothetical protein